MLCLVGGGELVGLAVAGFTLTWLHTIEKIPWEEDWLIEAGRLRVAEVRIKGSGAGMEPPAGAELRDGVWHYRPNLPALETLTLSHSPHAGEYTMCVHGKCRPLSALLPGLPGNNVVKIAPCAGSTAPGD